MKFRILQLHGGKKLYQESKATLILLWNIGTVSYTFKIQLYPIEVQKMFKRTY